MAARTARTAHPRWVHHASVDSTNDLVLAAARAGEATGLWVTADRQLKGRGRGGRAWASEPGNFHGSHLYVTARSVAALGLLPLAAGLAVRAAISDLLTRTQVVGEAVERGPDDPSLETGGAPVQSGFFFPLGRGQSRTSSARLRAAQDPEEVTNGGRNGETFPSPGRFAADLAPEGRGELALKWPNDVLLGGRKVAGILLESETLPGGGTAVAIGCGINLAHHPRDAAQATSLAEHGPGCTIPEVRPVLAQRMAEWLDCFEREPTRIAEAWLAVAHGLGGPIVVRLPSATFTGIFAGLDASGCLVLEEEGGGRRLISAGEVFFGARDPAAEGAA